MTHTEGELRLIVQQDRFRLVKERMEITAKQRALAKRLQAVDDRLEELSKADVILEGGLR